jgi:hypothetical protein
LLFAGAAGALTAGIALEARSLLKASPRTAIVSAILWCLSLTGFAATTSYPLASDAHVHRRIPQPLLRVHGTGAGAARSAGASARAIDRLFYLANSGLRAFSGITSASSAA